MKAWVVDASVAAKWLLPSAGEDLVTEANRLLTLHVHRELQLLAPAFIWAEIGNVLWKAVSRNRTTRASAGHALDRFRELGIKMIAVEELVVPALEIAIKYNLSVYDCLYVALAVQERGDLITADERLANALAAHFPVRWLGAFQE